MNNIKSVTLKSVTVMLSTFIMAGSVNADSQFGGLSYSPDHWPNRWSSAIRQKQNGQFPTRQKPRPSSNRAAREYNESVSEQDLFYSPDKGNRYTRDYNMDQFDDRAKRYHRHMHDARRLSREAAFAYNDLANMNGPYGGYGAYFGGASYGIGIDPVLGHPGVGIPIMPGVPLGYPIGGYPFGAYPYGGFPYGGGALNPPFGAW